MTLRGLFYRLVSEGVIGKEEHEYKNVGRYLLAIPSAVYGAVSSDRAPETLLRNWSWSAYLWDRPTAQAYAGLEGALDSLQAAWDTGHRHVTGSLELRAERHAREAEAQRERDAEAAKRDADELEKITDRLRVGYFRIPGATEAMFQRALPNLLERQRVDSALAGPPEVTSPISVRDILAS
ncbi:MAG: hypothetical protein H0T72_12975 [Chloroflexia bacterium]|nr:hypothetical protein [Chloroflexia bacterium]